MNAGTLRVRQYHLSCFQAGWQTAHVITYKHEVVLALSMLCVTF